MGEFFKWNPAVLGIGVEAMDAEHQVLVGHMNKLHDAHVQKLGKDALAPLLRALVEYTVTHLTDEEAHMVNIKFPGFDTHKMMHQELLQQLNEYASLFEKTGQLNEGFFKFLAAWLTSHIRVMDARYGLPKGAW